MGFLKCISFEALLNDLKLAFKHYSKFERKAVVTDKKWIHSVSPIADRIFQVLMSNAFHSGTGIKLLNG